MNTPSTAVETPGGWFGIPSVRRATLGLIVIGAVFGIAACKAACPERPLSFVHHPSGYYGRGQFVTACPSDDETIRCHHYHRHWVCAKKETLFWDRNLQTAARSACGCPPLPETLPTSPAVSGDPAQRVF